MNKSEEWGWYSQYMENRYGSSLYKDKNDNHVIVKQQYTSNFIELQPSNESSVI